MEEEVGVRFWIVWMRRSRACMIIIRRDRVTAIAVTFVVSSPTPPPLSARVLPDFNLRRSDTRPAPAHHAQV